MDDDTPDVLRSPAPPASGASSLSPYSRSHSLPSTSPALNHAHSMESGPPPLAATSTAAAAAAAAAAAGAPASAASSSSSPNLPPPGLDAFMLSQFPALFQQHLQQVDCSFAHPPFAFCNPAAPPAFRLRLLFFAASRSCIGPFSTAMLFLFSLPACAVLRCAVCVCIVLA